MTPQNSTTVRTLSEPAAAPPAHPAARVGLRALEALAPHLATVTAERLWFRLPTPPSAGQRDAATPPGGRPFTTRRGDLVVKGRVYGPEDAPTAHLVHGWAGWWQQLGAFVGPLLDAGYRVVAHDAPSHGASPAGRHGPRSSRVMEIADAYAAVVWQQGPADLVVAHSIGAMAAMWARERGTAAAAYAFVAAAASVGPMLDVFGGSLGLGPRTRDLLASRVADRIGHPLPAFEVPAMAARLATAGPRVTPLLAVHDLGDRMTPARGTGDIVGAWPGAELILTEGLGHRRILRDEQVVAHVARFAREHLWQEYLVTTT